MTTIAYRNGVLAGDSQVTDGQIWTADKLFDVSSSAGRLLVGVCGDVYAGLVFVEWLKNEKSRKPDIGNEDFEAIVIAESGRVTIWNQSLIGWRPKGKYFAIGSGGPVAMGAMSAGKGAIDAVKVACKHDPYTRGPVRSLRLK